MSLTNENSITQLTLNCLLYFFPAPKPVGRRARKPGIDRKPRQAYSAKQLDRLESEFKVKKIVKSFGFVRFLEIKFKLRKSHKERLHAKELLSYIVCKIS